MFLDVSQRVVDAADSLCRDLAVFKKIKFSMRGEKKCVGFGLRFCFEHLDS